MFMQLLFKCEWLSKQRPDLEFFNSLPLNPGSKVLEKNCHLGWSCATRITIHKGYWFRSMSPNEISRVILSLKLREYISDDDGCFLFPDALKRRYMETQGRHPGCLRLRQCSGRSTEGHRTTRWSMSTWR
jgi:hypothetical protein